MDTQSRWDSSTIAARRKVGERYLLMKLQVAVLMTSPISTTGHLSRWWIMMSAPATGIEELQWRVDDDIMCGQPLENAVPATNHA